VGKVRCKEIASFPKLLLLLVPSFDLRLHKSRYAFNAEKGRHCFVFPRNPLLRLPHRGNKTTALVSMALAATFVDTLAAYVEEDGGVGCAADIHGMGGGLP
jgi:hypothetical protein